jgi:hypothetical protein
MIEIDSFMAGATSGRKAGRRLPPGRGIYDLAATSTSQLVPLRVVSEVKLTVPLPVAPSINVDVCTLLSWKV